MKLTKILKTLFHLKTPEYVGPVRCLFCGGRTKNCCPVKGKVTD